MPKNKAKGRRGGGGQARGAEKLEQRQMRNAIASQTPAVHDIVSGVHFDDRVTVALFRDQWYACGHSVVRWPRIRKISRDGVRELCLGRLGNIDDVSHAMVEIPDEIGDLESLTKLDLNGCSSIKSLPDSIGELGALTELILNDCANLAALPETLCLCDSLTHLDLSGCSSLMELPISFSELPSLTRLNLSGCSGFVALPDSIGNLEAMSVLDASGCKSLRALPASFGLLRRSALEKLILHDCASLTALPDGQLGALTHLDMSGCSSLTSLSDTFKGLASLTELNLSRSGLVAIDADLEFPTTLRTLDLSDCASLVALPVKLDTIDNLSVIGADDVPRYDYEARIWDRLECRRCDACGRQFALDAPRLRVCCRCETYSYCNIECQRADWEDHRPRCSKLRKRYRRTCDVCGLQAADSDPPLPTCHCGEWRYCGEACQAQHWAAGHAEECASGYLHLGPRSPPNTPPRSPSTSPLLLRSFAWTRDPSDWEVSEGS